MDRHNNANNEGWVRIFNGHDGEWLARVVRRPLLSRGGAAAGTRQEGGRRGGVGGDKPLVAKCVSRIRAQDHALDGGRPWVLSVPLKKRHRTKAMIEKCTEIGAGRMMSIMSDRIEGNASHNNNGTNRGGVGGNVTAWLENKLGLISIESPVQCKWLDVPVIARNVALPARDNGGGSPSPLLCGGGLGTVRDFLPRWHRNWEGGGAALDEEDQAEWQGRTTGGGGCS